MEGLILLINLINESCILYILQNVGLDYHTRRAKSISIIKDNKKYLNELASSTSLAALISIDYDELLFFSLTGRFSLWEVGGVHKVRTIGRRIIRYSF